MVDIDPSDYPVAKRALMQGYKQHTIAALLGGFNQGRISEFKNGPIYPTVTPALSVPAGWPPVA